MKVIPFELALYKFEEWWKENFHESPYLHTVTGKTQFNHESEYGAKSWKAALSYAKDYYEKQLTEKDAVINFLKKELIHKTSFRQVMKRQYRELKQQMKADNERHTKMYADLVGKRHSVTWHFLKENPRDLPRNEGWVCNQNGLPCWYDITNDQWLDCEGTQVKTTAWCNMPHIKENLDI